MKNAMQKDFWREIQHTRSRFFSIMILVALSVAFLSGLKATAPDMKRTGDDYLDSLHLADIQVLSTLGLTDDDITSLRAQDKVEDAEGEYVIDAFASSDSLDAVVKVLSLTGRGINEVLLRGGRMPERADECVVEENMLGLLDIAIGDTITLEPDGKLSDALVGEEYTVVGTVRSPVYLAVERGTSTLGSGTVKAYLYLPREAFTLDYYTAAYVRVSGAAEMTAFLNPTENSYKRFGKNKAPAYVSWSRENRSQLVRIPAASGEYRRAELRSPDPTANPYAAFSLLIYAGLYGIENSIKLPEPADFNLFNADEKTLAGFEKLPQDFASACKIAASGDFIGEHMPSAILDTYFGR